MKRYAPRTSRIGVHVGLLGQYTKKKTPGLTHSNFEGTLCKALKTPKGPLEFFSITHGQRPMFFEFAIKITNLSPKDPIFWGFFDQKLQICKKKWIILKISIQIYEKKISWNFVTERPLFGVKSHFSPKDPSFL